MRTLYRVLAYLVAALVIVQAAMHAWASAGIAAYLGAGGTIDETAMPDFPEFVGIIVHGMNGMYVIPLVALALLVVSFFAKVPGGTMWAAIVLGLVVLQVTLGLLGHELTFLALLHGVNALLLFGSAAFAGYRVGSLAQGSRHVVGADPDRAVPVG